MQLSDDENGGTQPKSPPRKIPRRRIAKAGGRRIVASYQSLSSSNPNVLNNLIHGKCGCKANCFKQFRSNPATLQRWYDMRKLLAKMTKLEKDEHVISSEKNNHGLILF